jgi:hypothetical protein
VYKLYTVRQRDRRIHRRWLRKLPTLPPTATLSKSSQNPLSLSLSRWVQQQSIRRLSSVCACVPAAQRKGRRSIP